MSEPRYNFPRSLRITTPKDFQQVYNERISVNVGPLRVHARRNDLPHSRFGLSVSRRVGKAVVRNRNKRLLREALRQVQHELPGGYDLVISVRPHELLTLETYKNLLIDAARRVQGIWNRRQGKLPNEAQTLDE